MSLLLHCDGMKTPSVQTWFVYFFVSVHPLSTNFGRSQSDFRTIKLLLQWPIEKDIWVKLSKPNSPHPTLQKGFLYLLAEGTMGE